MQKIQHFHLWNQGPAWCEHRPQTWEFREGSSLSELPRNLLFNRQCWRTFNYILEFSVPLIFSVYFVKEALSKALWTENSEVLRFLSDWGVHKKVSPQVQSAKELRKWVFISVGRTSVRASVWLLVIQSSRSWLSQFPFESPCSMYRKRLSMHAP